MKSGCYLYTSWNPLVTERLLQHRVRRRRRLLVKECFLKAIAIKYTKALLYFIDAHNFTKVSS